MNSIVLTYQELRELTGKQKMRSIRMELDKMKIDYKERRDGSPAVLRQAFLQEFGIAEFNDRIKPKLRSLNA